MSSLLEFYSKIYQTPMIREPGNPQRIDTPLRSIEDVEDFVNKCKGNKPAFKSIYSYSEDYKVTYQPGNNGNDTRIAEYPQPIFDRIILDFDIDKVELLKSEGYNSEDLRVKGEELLKEEGKAVNRVSAIRRGTKFYLDEVKDKDALAVGSLTKGKKVNERQDIIMKYYYDKYTSKEYLLQPYREAIKVSEFVQSQFQVKPLLFFSGGHGVHLHIYFNPVDIDNVGEVVEQFGLKLEENLDLQTLDSSVIKSVHQHLIRIPLSRHQDTKLYVTPFDSKTSYFEVMDTALSPNVDINVDEYVNQDTRLLEDFLYSYSEFVDKVKTKNKPNNLNYEYTLNGSLFDLVEPFARIYQEGQRNLTAYPLLHFFKGASIPKEDAEEFIRTLPGGNGLDKNEQSWVDTAYSTDKPYQDNMGHLVNTIKRYSSNEDEAKYIIAKFNEYFNSSTNIPGEVELSPGLVQFHDNQYYKDGIYNKKWNKEKGSYDYLFKGNILLHELNTTYDILGEFNPVVSIKYTNTTINKTLSIEDKSFSDISQRIHKAQLIDTNIQGIESILRKISIHSVNKDLGSEVTITANEDLFMQGFFYDENQDKILHNNEFNDIQSSREDIQNAIKLSNELISNRGTAKPNDSTVFRCMLWSPYGYALKQLGFNKSLYGLVLWGVRDTNKTGSCENYSYLYNKPNVIKQDADTPSAFGSRLGENTYTLLVDEAWNLLSNKDNEEVIKKAITNITVRAVKNKYDSDKIDEYPGLRIPIYTMNDNPPLIEKEEVKKRYRVLYYDNSMKLSKNQIKEFIKRYKPESPDSPLNQLKHLGKLFASKFEVYLADKSSKLHDLEALTVDILKEIAEEYDTPFDTAYYTIQEYDADDEDLGATIRTGLNKLFFKKHKTYGYDGINGADFEFSAKYGEFTWLDYQPTNERYVIHVKEFEKEVSNITREYLQIEDIFDALDITLDVEDNKNGFKTYTKFKGKTTYAVKIKEFDLIFKMFKMDIYEEGKVEEILEHEEKQKQRQRELKEREQEFDKIVSAKVIK